MLCPITERFAVKKKSFTAIYAYDTPNTAGKIRVCVSGGTAPDAHLAARTQADKILADWGLDRKTHFVGFEE